MRRVFEQHVRPRYQRLRRAITDSLYERRYGLRTNDLVSLDELGIAAPERVYYGPSPWRVLPRLLPVRAVGPDDVLVDYGSGMGRVLFVAAARYPLRRVVGLELSEDLNAIARENIERNRDRLRCRDVEILTADAATWDPPDDMTIAYFNNPFVGELFGTVVERMMASLDRNPRRLRIVYRNPIEHDRLMATGRIRVLRRARGWRPKAEWSRANSAVLYEAR